MVRGGELGKVVEEYFKLLFSSEDVGVEMSDWANINLIVTGELNENLMSPVTREEVKQAVFDINPQKCPSPDGMSGYLFQHFWKTMAEDLTRMV